MSIREIVRADFEEFIRIDPSVPNGLRSSLKLKERVPSFVDRIAAEIIQVEVSGVKFTREDIKMMVYDLSRIFVHLLKTKAHEAEMSDLARAAMKNQIEGDEIIQKLDKDGNADLTDELGVIIKDKATGD
jgi:hypothetical protein